MKIKLNDYHKKVNAEKNLAPFFDRIKAHNQYFPDCPYKYYTNGQHDIFDAVAGNVLVGGDGNYYFIDTIIYPSDTGGYDLYRSLSPRFSGEGV